MSLVFVFPHRLSTAKSSFHDNKTTNTEIEPTLKLEEYILKNCDVDEVEEKNGLCFHFFKITTILWKIHENLKD